VGSPPPAGRHDVREPHRIPSLDGVRGLAILLVMFLHFSDRSRPIGLVNRLYTQATGAGWAGVDLFFVLSGFLITGLLIDSRTSPRYFRDFYARRTLRIFPLYYACLVWWIVIAPFVHTSSAVHREVIAAMHRDQLWYWTYLSNWKMGLDGAWPLLGTSVYWSLAIEEQFYLVWPAIVRLSGERRLRYVCLALIAGAFAVRSMQTAAGASPIFVYVSTFGRMDALAVGSLTAIALRDPARRERARKSAPWLLTLGVTCLAAIWIWIGTFSEYHPLMQTAGFTILAITFGSLIVEAVRPASRIAGVFSSPVLRFFGKYSYAMYLFHETVTLEVVPRVPAGWIIPGEMGAQVTGLGVSMAATIALAWVSWHVWEKHFLALKRRFSQNGTTSMPATSRPAAIRKSP
jgi:peptidoglycan/LPS O-acetylase OafA/YrhL